MSQDCVGPKCNVRSNKRYVSSIGRDVRSSLCASDRPVLPRHRLFRCDDGKLDSETVQLAAEGCSFSDAQNSGFGAKNRKLADARLKVAVSETGVAPKDTCCARQGWRPCARDLGGSCTGFRSGEYFGRKNSLVPAARPLLSGTANTKATVDGGARRTRARSASSAAGGRHATAKPGGEAIYRRGRIRQRRLPG